MRARAISRPFEETRRRRGAFVAASATTADRRQMALPFELPLRSVYPQAAYPLAEVEDRRLWNPEGDFAPARSVSRPRHRLVAPKKRLAAPVSFWTPPAAVLFNNPSKVLICVRRKMRREVMFARHHAGKSGQRRPRYNAYSRIHCR